MKCVGNTLYTCGIDDTLRLVEISANIYTNVNDVKLGSQPRGMDVANNRVFIATVKEASCFNICNVTLLQKSLEGHLS